jgi:DNA-binding PadR family transcriptional regulator
MTLQTLKVLREMVAAPTRAHYGLELIEAAGLPSGTIYPVLARLEKADWVSSGWEDVDPHEVKRPRRRFYTLTGKGAQRARAELAAAGMTVASARTRIVGRPGRLRPQAG